MLPPRFKIAAPLSLMLTLAALAGGASAQVLAPNPSEPKGTLLISTASLARATKLSDVLAGGFRQSDADTPTPTGIAPTAVDHTLSSSGLMASAGFLCGLKSAPDNNGAASALGYDPHGRFVGARLSYAFR